VGAFEVKNSYSCDESDVVYTYEHGLDPVDFEFDPINQKFTIRSDKLSLEGFHPIRMIGTINRI
jgi:hypothetical protein